MNGRKKYLFLFLVVAILLGFSIDYTLNQGTGNQNSKGTFKIVNLTADLGTYFTPGSIQAFGYNNSGLLLTGATYYNKSTEATLPALMRINSLNGTSIGTGLDSITAKYFRNGTVFGAGWNGTDWLLTGEVSFGNTDEAGIISMNGDNIANLTETIGKYFKNGGAWFDSWNGTGWLIAGNVDKRACLVGYYHGEIINYTAELGFVPQDSWIQYLSWNGSSWLVSGHSIFGFLQGKNYINMLNMTVFRSSGVYSACYTSQGEWIVGGGPPAKLELIRGQKVIANISLPPKFNQWVNGITKFDGLYILGGKGANKSDPIFPALYSLNLSGVNWNFTDLSSLLPSSFDEGQVQFLSFVDFKNTTGVLIAGQGHYNINTGYSTGSLALLT